MEERAALPPLLLEKGGLRRLRRIRQNFVAFAAMPDVPGDDSLRVVFVRTAVHRAKTMAVLRRPRHRRPLC